MSHSVDREDDRLRFGMDPPRLEEELYWWELVPGHDEWHPCSGFEGARRDVEADG